MIPSLYSSKYQNKIDDETLRGIYDRIETSTIEVSSFFIHSKGKQNCSSFIIHDCQFFPKEEKLSSREIIHILYHLQKKNFPINDVTYIGQDKQLVLLVTGTKKAQLLEDDQIVKYLKWDKLFLIEESDLGLYHQLLQHSTLTLADIVNSRIQKKHLAIRENLRHPFMQGLWSSHLISLDQLMTVITSKERKQCIEKLENIYAQLPWKTLLVLYYYAKKDSSTSTFSTLLESKVQKNRLRITENLQRYPLIQQLWQDNLLSLEQIMQDISLQDEKRVKAHFDNIHAKLHSFLKNIIDCYIQNDGKPDFSQLQSIQIEKIEELQNFLNIDPKHIILLCLKDSPTVREQYKALAQNGMYFDGEKKRWAKREIIPEQQALYHSLKTLIFDHLRGLFHSAITPFDFYRTPIFQDCLDIQDKLSIAWGYYLPKMYQPTWKEVKTKVTHPKAFFSLETLIQMLHYQTQFFQLPKKIIKMFTVKTNTQEKNDDALSRFLQLSITPSMLVENFSKPLPLPDLWILERILQCLSSLVESYNQTFVFSWLKKLAQLTPDQLIEVNNLCTTLLTISENIYHSYPTLETLWHLFGIAELHQKAIINIYQPQQPITLKTFEANMANIERLLQFHSFENTLVQKCISDAIFELSQIFFLPIEEQVHKNIIYSQEKREKEISANDQLIEANDLCITLLKISKKTYQFYPTLEILWHLFDTAVLQYQTSVPVNTLTKNMDDIDRALQFHSFNNALVQRRVSKAIIEFSQIFCINKYRSTNRYEKIIYEVNQQRTYRGAILNCVESTP